MRRLLELIMIAAHAVALGCSPSSASQQVESEVLFSIDTVIMELSHTAVQLGTPESDELIEELERANAESMNGLRHTPDDGMVGFAFVISSCTVDETVLIVSADEISLEFTEEDGVMCMAPAAYLVTYEIAEDEVPDTAVLTDARRAGQS